MSDQIKQRIIERHNDIIEKACQLFPQFKTFPKPTVYFYETGKAAGLAHGYSKVGYNVHVFAQDVERFTNDTVPHEIAHIVCNALRIGKGHDLGWKRVCRMLGGNAQRCYDGSNIEHKQIRTRRQYQYRATCGTLVMLSDVRHNRLQRDHYAAVVVTRTGGKIERSGFTGVVK